MVGPLVLLLRPEQLPLPEGAYHAGEDEQPDEHDAAGHNATDDLQGKAVQGSGEVFGSRYLYGLSVSWSTEGKQTREEATAQVARDVKFKDLTRAVFGKTNENHVI